MRQYIKKNGFSLILGICLVAFVYFFLKTYMNFSFAIWISIFVLAGFLVILFYPYCKERKLFRALEKNGEQMLFFENNKTLEKGFFGEKTLALMQEMDRRHQDELNEAERLSHNMEEYITLWVHEVKTPLATMNLMLDNHPGEFSDELREQLEKTEGFVDQAMYYARSLSPREDYIIRKISLEDVINRVLRDNARTLIARQVKMTMENLAVEVYTDSKWLEFILQQLMNNALQYSKDKPEFVFSAEEKEEEVLLRFRDNGKGIAEKDLPKVFQRGYTGERGREFHRSTGMGLYLCRKLSLRLGMDIDIDSKEGEFTEVRLIFPREKVTPERQ